MQDSAGILILQAQTHGSDRRFDLMRPHRIVIDHIRISAIGISLIGGIFLTEKTDDLLIILILDLLRRGEGPDHRVGDAADGIERFVFFFTRRKSNAARTKPSKAQRTAG